MATKNRESWQLGNDSLWYKDAIIYEIHVKAFSDSNEDGVGDFRGLINKLDYLEDLGVTALWLLPFYLSPLKDDGYDISDYTKILPVYGDMQDFITFVDEAHRRNIHVITELVLNHTSDQHPWFQRALRAPSGSRYRNYYVWNDSPEKYRDARTIFKDYENSNWTWDHQAKAYFWHRFYHHQPDLNYDSKYVQRAMLKVMDFWLNLGVDGLRADAVPYLYEREGTNCENLKETHDFLKELRAHIDKRFNNRMLLAEANQWPEEAVTYLGEGDEFHMAFHFPLMPRLFMAIRMEDRFPIIDILQQTPPIPDTCQWAVFLRNHDELTLEMVTDEERDYMYRVYATDPAARINLGIRRRLAPLLNNDRKKIELMNALLFSLPGTPVIYYGDEIGMGDNFYLGDRNGVRTPMQWSPDRNSGFSRANPQRLYLPPIIDPEYHYEAINVETQQTNPDSLLWWMKRIIALRKRYKAFGRGSLEFLQPENRKVLAFLRRYNNETILIVSNLSRMVQQTKLDLSQFEGCRPSDLFSRTQFDPITDEKYYFTLSPYAFYWFSLESEAAEVLRIRAIPTDEAKTIPIITETEEKLFIRRNWFILEAVLLEYVRGRRWFHGKSREPWAAQIRDVIPISLNDSMAYFILLEVEYTEGESETYVLPLIASTSVQATDITTKYPNEIIAYLKPKGRNGDEKVLYDAMVDRSFNIFLLKAIGGRRRYKGKVGELRALPTRIFSDYRKIVNSALEPTPLNVEQSNTSVVYGNQLIVKLFRSPDEGINPDLEIGRFLTQKTKFKHVSQVAGALEYNRKGCETISLAIAQEFVVNEGDAWQYTLDSLERYLEDVLAHPTVQLPPVPRKHMLSLLKEPPPLAKETIGLYLNSAELLGQRTAELHKALSSITDDPDFAPEPITFMYQTSLYQSMRTNTIRTLRVLREQLSNIPEDSKEDALKVISLENDIIERYQPLRKQRISAKRFRCHGDYHLGQVLFTGKDFVIIDFEGEPARPLSERRRKHSPLMDLAGMIRSFHYAAHSALIHQVPLAPRPEDDVLLLKHWAQYWYYWVSVTFLTSYLGVIKPAYLIPEDPAHLRILLDGYMLEKAIYEIGYELNNRPDWINVPLQAIMELIETEE
jgi:maltose alpha-D-glucosyltransferase/alpha-amylase